jgi:hypothetical protein
VSAASEVGGGTSVRVRVVVAGESAAQAGRPTDDEGV